jgi:hypothetical protein
VAVDLPPLAGQTLAGPGSDVGQSAPHKSGRNNTMGGKSPEFLGNNWSEDASRNVTSQASWEHTSNIVCNYHEYSVQFSDF